MMNASAPHACSHVASRAMKAVPGVMTLESKAGATCAMVTSGHALPREAALWAESYGRSRAHLGTSSGVSAQDEAPRCLFRAVPVVIPPWT